jgi:hypothetical protein
MRIASMGTQILKLNKNLCKIRIILRSPSGGGKFGLGDGKFWISYNVIDIDVFDHAEYDWENSHFSKVAAANESHDQSQPLHHDDVIIKAVSVQQDMHSEEEQVHAQVWNCVDYIILLCTCTLYIYAVISFYPS